jgi:hypothetical protein
MKTTDRTTYHDYLVHARGPRAAVRAGRPGGADARAQEKAQTFFLEARKRFKSAGFEA